ncbi:hypothetical protein VE02_06596 [Pseudogymnoascus sp. 03VT05]|nr:hypothetical protein VE02_06596 [Pseudogymnoascus sp. 03VT05]
MDRHGRSRSCRCDSYDDDAYYRDRYANNFYDRYKHSYSYHKTRDYDLPHRRRENHYYHDDDPYLPSYSPYYRHSYRTRDEQFIPHLFEEEYPTQKLVDEYTRPVGWFYEHLVSRTGRVVRASTVRLWAGLRRTAVLGTGSDRRREKHVSWQ